MINYRRSNRDVIHTTRTSLQIENEFGNKLSLELQPDGKLRVSAWQEGNTVHLRLNSVEVQHLKELLGV